MQLASYRGVHHFCCNHNSMDDNLATRYEHLCCSSNPASDIYLNWHYGQRRAQTNQLGRTLAGCRWYRDWYWFRTNRFSKARARD